MCRQSSDETLAVIHTFGGGYPQEIRVPVEGERILRVMSSENNPVRVEDGQLIIGLKADFEAIAVHLAK